MFQKFEQELIQSTECFLELKTEDASKVVFNVSERKNWETRVAEVVYVKDSDHASCSCKKFEFLRIICKYILALFRRDQIEYMPDKNILKRWKKTAKSGLVSDENGNEIKDSADPGLLIKSLGVYIVRESFNFLFNEVATSAAVVCRWLLFTNLKSHSWTGVHLTITNLYSPILDVRTRHGHGR
ncbi:hypothetical protein L3X38_032388 [Prunus dulcis]|uniref:Protein FAR1-RELATED SEQUENCE n=1 Tax=Prunus dulcis TaxID=3755 RepID=A0AAD4YVV9_PRUDU|nr:hypothetical protein L3X38_032388 [Prunus dulcis]